ncbi:PREDICTED: protein LEG1 homolog [Ceratotherium simum simum]|uniref:Protein LEG1 homolog n=1 Tax=Ceratotherium simum simum TaxID=73337 RepID=A0ABM0H9L9_CERSS|nr:PREDICTED: protein LEG1 homolog [Ceratotherium simum simum]
MGNEKMWSSVMTPTFLFLSFFSVGLPQNPGSATDESDNYPPFWDQINGDIAEFPVQNNKTIIDPWNYLDRLQMYKILITQSNKYFAGFGQNNTGRYSEPPNSSICAYEAGGPGCISINSGWGGITFYMIVISFLAAIESEFLTNLPYEVELISREEYRSNFCYSIVECRATYPRVMDAANQYYQYLQSRKIVSIIRDIPKYDTDEDTVIFYMWKLHRTAVEAGQLKFSDISFYSSETERDFTKDFILAIEFCEDARYRPYFESSAEFLVGFPHRLLTDQDHHILTSSFSVREKALLNSVRLISKVNGITDGKTHEDRDLPVLFSSLMSA